MDEELTHPSRDIVGKKGSQLSGVRVVLCVTGSIAAVEAPEIARELMRYGADVWAVMSPAAQMMISPQALHWATGHPVTTHLTGNLEHISLLQASRVVVLVAPATANTISKIGHGIDDTPVTTLCSMALGLGLPVLVAPAMHEPMQDNPFVRESLERLRSHGVIIIPPRVEEGKAKIAETHVIVQRVIGAVGGLPLRGKKVVVTAGPTVEHIDPVRVITNRSSGAMGFALAERARDLGADVTLILGPTPLTPPGGVEVVRVMTTEEMKEALEEALQDGADIVMAAAAPADFRPAESSPRKLDTRKTPGLALSLVPTPRVIGGVKRLRPESILVAFKAETEGDQELLVERARMLMDEVQADVVVANDVSSAEAGFSAARLRGVMVTRSEAEAFEGSKGDVASRVLGKVLGLMKK
jgi:phosphopantothenoylcysteine decarboxylase/phosphopantothenate--cysteine ligase